MSKSIKLTIKGNREDLISFIDHLPTEAIQKMKVVNPENKNKQVRKLKLKAKMFNLIFAERKRCLESDMENQ